MSISPATLLIVVVSLAAASVGQMGLTATTPERASSAVKPEPVANAKAVSRFERLGIAGERLVDSEAWFCVADKETDLIWEVKTVDGGVRDSAHSYSWFNPDLNSQKGVEDGGRCGNEVKCDTHHYQISLNQERLCGFDDWRLPSRDELETLVKFQTKKSSATIDERFFPGAAASWYWTASSNANNPDYAWYVLFRSGVPLNDLKARPKHVRLVRGGKPPLASNQ